MHAISVSRMSLSLRLKRRWVGWRDEGGGQLRIRLRAAESRVTVVGRVSLGLHGGMGEQVR